MADRNIVSYLTSPIRKMASKIPIRRINAKLYYSDEYMVVAFCMKDTCTYDGEAIATGIWRLTY